MSFEELEEFENSMKVKIINNHVINVVLITCNYLIY